MGKPIKAQFSVESADGEISVVVESRGGSIGGPQERNAEYNQGVGLLLSRLAERYCILEDAVVDTKTTQRMGLSREDRRLAVDSFPIDIRSSDSEALRMALCRLQRSIGQKPSARELMRAMFIFGKQNGEDVFTPEELVNAGKMAVSPRPLVKHSIWTIQNTIAQ